MGAKHPLPERVPLPEKEELEHLESLGISFTDLPGVTVKNSDTEQRYVKMILPKGWQFLPTKKDDDKPRYAIVDLDGYIRQSVGGEWIYRNYLHWLDLRWDFVSYVDENGNKKYKPWEKYIPPEGSQVESMLSSNKLGKTLTELGSSKEGNILGAVIAKQLVDSTDDVNEKFNFAKAYVDGMLKRK